MVGKRKFTSFYIQYFTWLGPKIDLWSYSDQDDGHGYYVLVLSTAEYNLLYFFGDLDKMQNIMGIFSWFHPIFLPF